MMTVIPEKRIGISELLSHPWLVQGYGSPISAKSTYLLSVLDDEVVTELAVSCGRSKSSVVVELSQWRYDYMTATYLLLVLKKSHGKVLRLDFPDYHPKEKQRSTLACDGTAWRRARRRATLRFAGVRVQTDGRERRNVAVYNEEKEDLRLSLFHYTLR
ncbi:hypothetical protein MRX96_006444 [Rhipicephalus microplus]